MQVIQPKMVWPGLFGWCAAPLVFGVLSRAFCRLLQRRLPLSCIHLYVDDSIGLTLAELGAPAQVVVQESGRGVFGPSAMEATKSCPPAPAQVVIGWYVDLLRGSIRPS